MNFGDELIAMCPDFISYGHAWTVWVPAYTDKPNIKNGKMPIQFCAWTKPRWMEVSHSLS